MFPYFIPASNVPLGRLAFNVTVLQRHVDYFWAIAACAAASLAIGTRNGEQET